MTTPPPGPSMPVPLPPGQPPHPAPASAPAGKRRNTLGLVALICAAVGFVFACIPGALIVGWVLLPAGFVLGVVSLFQKGARWPGIWAIVVSLLGTIVGAVVFFTVVSGAVDEALGGDSTVVTPAQSADAGQEAGAEEVTSQGEAAETDAPAEAESPAGDVGTRENPAPLGSTVVGNEWEIIVNSVEFNATDAVLEANMFNEPPAEGMTYALVNVSATYTGADSSSTMMVTIDYVTAGGEVVRSFDALAVAPDPSFGMAELFTGATDTGNLVLQVPADGSGLLRVTPGLFADAVFVATE